MLTETLTDNATTVAKMYDAFGRGDIASILNNIADGCTWVGAGEGSLPQGGTYMGKDAVNFFKRLGEAEEFNAFNPTSINNIHDDEVVAFGNMTATTRSTGKQVMYDWVMHWKFNDEGKVVYYHDFFDTAAAYLATIKNGATDESKREQKLAVVRDAFENFRKGNIQAILDVCTDDVMWDSHQNPEVPFGKTYYGKQGAGDFFAALGNSVDYSTFDPKDYYADGDKVFVKGYHQAKVKSTGNSFGHKFLMEFTMRDGMVAKFFSWIDTRDEAAAFKS